MPSFNKISIEPTFYFDLKKANLRVEKMNEDTFDNFQSNFVDYFFYSLEGKKHKLLRHAYEDNCVLEVPFRKATVAQTIANYKIVQRILAAKNFVPSSVVCMESEGGCHLNVDLAGVPHKIRLLTNLQNYLLANPSIVWAFLSPYDDQSSAFRTCSIFDLRKGSFFTVRENNGNMPNVESKIGYVELRFFCMIKNSKELKVNIEFVQKLLEYLLANDIELPKNWDLQNITQKKEIEKLKTVCKQIGFPYETLKKYGKVQNLKDRFDIQKISPYKRYLI